MQKGELKTREIGTKIYVPGKNDKVAQIPLEWEKEKDENC